MTYIVISIYITMGSERELGLHLVLNNFGD
jgi:hypothetical protein